MLELKKLTTTLLLAGLISTGSYASSSWTAATVGFMLLGFSTFIDVSIIQENNRLEKNYARSEMIVVGYQIDKAPCQVCVGSAAQPLCLVADFKAQTQNEFVAYVSGVQTTQHVLSESICGADENDANITVTKRFPLSTKTAIWYKKTNPSVWQKADNTELVTVSKWMYYAGCAAFLLPLALRGYKLCLQQGE